MKKQPALKNTWNTQFRVFLSFLMKSILHGKYFKLKILTICTNPH